MDVKLNEFRKTGTTLAFCAVAFMGLAQEVVVIDKDQQTASLFNYDDPFSLVSLVKFNWIEEITPMDSNAIQHLKELNWLDSVYYFDGKAVTTPLIDEDPDSPNFGEPLTFEDPETGMITFIYPETPRYYYDVDDITRILLYKGQVLNPITGEKYFGIKEIGFAKKYLNDKKYTVTMKIPFAYLMRMDAFKTIVKLPEEVKKELSDRTNERSLFNQVMEDRLSRREKGLTHERDTARRDVIKMDYYDPCFRIMSHGFSRFRLPKNSWGAESKGYQPSGIAIKHCFQVPFTSFDEKIMKEYFNVTDTTIVDATPLINEDPTSPDFGEPLTKKDENGNLTYVYPEESFTFYVDFEPKNAFVLIDFNYMDAKNKRNFGQLPEQLLFTGATENEEHMVFNVYFFEENIKALNKRVELSKFNEFISSLPTYDKLNWRKLIVSQSNKTEGLLEVGSKTWNKQFN